MPVVNLLLHGASATDCTVYVNFCVWRCRLGGGGGIMALNGACDGAACRRSNPDKLFTC